MPALCFSLLNWIRWRAILRLAFAGCFGLTASIFAGAHEGTVRRSPRVEALLFPPIAGQSTPLQLLLPSPSPTPRLKLASLPSSAPPLIPTAAFTPTPKSVPTPTPLEDAVDGQVTINLDKRDLDAGNFSVSGSDAATRWEVRQVRCISDVEETKHDGKPLSALLLFDQSGSIRETDRDNNRIPAAQRLVRLLPGGTRFGMAHFPDVHFWTQSAVHLDLPFVDDKDAVTRKIEGLGNPGGATPLLSALDYSIGQLNQEPDGRERILVCMTDGLPEGDSGVLTPTQIASEARAAKVHIYFVTLGNMDWQVQAWLAHSTGGDVVAATDASKLESAFQNIARQVSRTEHSHYEVILRAHRTGQRFKKGEILKGTIHVQGQEHAFHLTVG